MAQKLHEVVLRSRGTGCTRCGDLEHEDDLCGRGMSNEALSNKYGTPFSS